MERMIRPAVEAASVVAVGVGLGAALGWAWGLFAVGAIILVAAVVGRMR